MHLIIIPTYNEINNVSIMLDKLSKYRETSDILFIDDNSPDGTGKKLDKIALVYKNVNILHRKQKEGVGGAHIIGLMWAYKNNYKTVITMDCDFTHSPDDIQKFIDKKDDADLIIGTRFHMQNGLADWPLFRKIVTNTSHFLTTIFLNIKYDSTGAFRLYNISKIQKEIFFKVDAPGYSFFFKSVFLISFNKYKILEIPIILSARASGNSKMKLKDAIDGIIELLKLFVLRIFYRSKLKL